MLWFVVIVSAMHFQSEQARDLPSTEDTEVEGASRGFFYCWRWTR